MERIDRVATSDGHVLELFRHNGDFNIFLDGQQLMSSRMHSSEEALARLTCRGLGQESRVLIGGLGLGFTAKAALEELPRRSTVVVAELFPCVRAWHRDYLGDLARPLDDPRLTVVERDVYALASPQAKPWDAILLDTDNGPEALCVDANHKLYSQRGIERLSSALLPGGVLGVWATGPDPRFVKRLSKSGFVVRTEGVRAHRGKGSKHTILLARKPG